MRESHSTPQRVGVLGGDEFFFDLQRQDATYTFSWTAYAHKIRDLGAAGTQYVNRFPYVTDMVLDAFLESFYGLQF